MEQYYKIFKEKNTCKTYEKKLWHNISIYSEQHQKYIKF